MNSQSKYMPSFITHALYASIIYNVIMRGLISQRDLHLKLPSRKHIIYNKLNVKLFYAALDFIHLKQILHKNLNQKYFFPGKDI